MDSSSSDTLLISEDEDKDNLGNIYIYVSF